MPEYTIDVTHVYHITAGSEEEALEKVAESEPDETLDMKVVSVDGEIEEFEVPDDADHEALGMYHDFELYRVKSQSGKSTIGYMAEWTSKVETIQHATRRLKDLKRLVDETYPYDPAHPQPSQPID